jgi:hypothetical protein
MDAKSLLMRNTMLFRYFPQPFQRDFVRALVDEPYISTSRKKTYCERFRELNINEIPEKYLDPISHQVMNDPVIGQDMYIYDRSVAATLIISPFTREPFKILCESTKISSDIEIFLKQKEEELERRNNCRMKN